MADPVLVKTAEESRDDILTQVEIETGISDRNIGAVVRSLAYAVGAELEHLAYQVYKSEINGYLKRATGTALDNIGADWGITRRSEAKATGTVTLSHSSSASIPAGTQYAVPATVSSDRILFEIATGGSVVGSGTTDFSVRAIRAGNAGNVSSANITEIVTVISGITSVTNAAATSGGQDQEDDDTYRERIAAHIEGLSRGTPVSIQDGALNFAIESVQLAAAMDNSQTYMDTTDLDLAAISDAGGTLAILDSSGNLAEIVTYGAGAIDTVNDRISPIVRGVSPGPSATSHAADSVVEEYIPSGYGRTVKSVALVETPGNVNVYIDDGQTNGTTAQLRSLVENRLRGDGTSRDPGYRAAGITLSVYVASRITPTVTATIQGTASPSAVKAAVEQYLNNRKMGEDAPAYEIAAIISNYPGVENIASGTLVINGVTHVGTSSADVTTTSTEIIYAGTVTIS